MILSISDVQNVRTEGMGAAIAATAQNVATAYLGTAPASNERLIAEDIFAIWIDEAAQEVRETLSQQLRDCPHLPRKLAIKIAEDVEPVAVPILLSSEVFTDDDLCALVTGGSLYHQITLARRNFVPHALTEALIKTEREDVVTTLVNNTGAKLSEPALHQVIDYFPSSQSIHIGVVERDVLPVSVGYRLLTFVSEALQVRLSKRLALPKILVGELAGLTRNAASSAQKFVNYLHGVHQLTPTVLLRALCDESIDVFEAGLVCVAQFSLEEVQKRLRMNDMAAQIDLFARAGIPKPLTLAFRAGVDTIINGTPEMCDTDNAKAQISAVVAQMVKIHEDTDRAGIEAVLTRLNYKIEDAIRKTAIENELRALGTPKSALSQPQTRSKPSKNIVQLRPTSRFAPPSVFEPAGARIAAGRSR
ncbi:MAG: DUF2336 domain-containing protein [Alphaproteobacteria bacterium]|nr:DUF2336 domain-containing protein [Alphaproteobacteria bacterium]